MLIKSVFDFNREIQEPQFAHGGYPKYFLTDDGEVLSFEAAAANAGRIRDAIRAGPSRGNEDWLVIGIDLNYEDNELFCSHTHKRIPSGHGLDLECLHADTCLPDYWGGYHLPHIQIPVYPGMTLDEIKKELLSELDEGAIGAQAPDEDDDQWYEAAEAAIRAITSTATDDRHFTELEEPSEDGDSVYAYFVFRTAEL